MAGIKQWYYRGSLRSCNYRCSYCPFSKRGAASPAELAQDEENLIRFTDKMREMGDGPFSVQIVPYGEALVHSYYVRELARLSRNSHVELVGCQSNFSFSVREFLDVYTGNGGDKKKLRLWGTFHPEMTTVDAFVSQCRELEAEGIRFCAGVVGDTRRMDEIHRLRQMLPDDSYLWINRMDGMERVYQTEEICRFSEIDPYFPLELAGHSGDRSVCLDSCFVSADGRMKHCNIATGSFGNLYGEYEEGDNPCRRKRCDCFLSYCNQQNPECQWMEPYPAFRIPVFPKAVFMDLDGTLLAEGEKLSPVLAARLRGLSRFTKLFVASSRTEQSVLRELSAVRDCLSGGVYACGADCVLYVRERGQKAKRKVCPLPVGLAAELGGREKGKRVYRHGEDIYKITFPNKRWQDIFIENEGVRIVLEESVLQIVSREADKGAGVQWICEQCGVSPAEAWAFGNGTEDEAMFSRVGHAVRIHR